MSEMQPSTSMQYGPIGTVLGPGSTNLRMTEREKQVAEMVSLGWKYKKIGRELGISTANVGAHVSNIAQRIPGVGKPLQRVSAWVWVYGSGSHTE